MLPGQVSPMLEVPDDIAPTDYYQTGVPLRRAEPMVKPPDVIARMRTAGRVAAEVLQVTGAAVAPGVTTDELDRIAHQAYIDRGAFPSTLNYHSYPKSICTSVNEVICHGIPDDRPLEDGDIVNVDVTAFIDGVHGDCSATFLVGEVDDESRQLVEVTRQCRDLGIEAVRPGGRCTTSAGPSRPTPTPTATEWCGRSSDTGSAASSICPPACPTTTRLTASTVMEPGMTFTIEPMITLGIVAGADVGQRLDGGHH